MSRVACVVWADLADDSTASTEYEDTHVPNVVAKLGCTARNCEQAEDNMFKEVAGIDGSIMTLYDLPDGVDVKAAAAQIQPDAAKLPKDARIDTRVYDELSSAQTDGATAIDTRDVQMFIIVLWQPVDAVHDDFVEWFRTDFAPGMLESPELLRTRIFKLQHATLHEGGKVEEKSTSGMYQYMTIWEFDQDELPWEILVYLGSSERWRHYVEGGYLSWQIGQFLVNRIYPETEEVESRAASRTSLLLSSSSGSSESFQGDSDAEDDNLRTP